MKPSEILDATLAIDIEITDLKRRIDPLKERINVLGFARDDIRALLDQGEPWGKVEERLSDLKAGIIPDAVSDRKPRADKGVPRGPKKAHVTEGRTSPLTAELREKLEKTLALGPTQLPEIAKMSWAAGMSQEQIEGLLCEDPAAFVSWENEDVGGLVTWGLWKQFLAEVKAHCVRVGPYLDHPAGVAALSSKFGCLASHAQRAIVELRPANV